MTTQRGGVTDSDPGTQNYSPLGTHVCVYEAGLKYASLCVWERDDIIQTRRKRSEREQKESRGTRQRRWRLHETSSTPKPTSTMSQVGLKLKECRVFCINFTFNFVCVCVWLCNLFTISVLTERIQRAVLQIKPGATPVSAACTVISRLLT